MRITNGITWYDQNNNPVNAHGACIVYENGKYYLFGEYKTDDVNKYIGFSCYSTVDFSSWQFEGLALSPMSEGLLGPDRIGERVKVFKSRKTGKYIMLMHTDDMKYCDPCIGLAISDTITGPYTMLGPLLYQGEPIRRWDMGTFVDEDGTAYLLLHGGSFYRLNDEGTAAVEMVCDGLKPHGEAPTIYKHGGLYYAMFSKLTSWERNDNFYFTAPSMAGPWTYQGYFCPEGTLTHNTQCSFSFPLETDKGIVPVYVGDRWSFPMQASAATLVMLPMSFDQGKLSIPKYLSCWDPQTLQEVPLVPSRSVDFVSNSPEQHCDISFEGTEISLFGKTNREGGYAQVELLDEHGNVLHRSVVDFYSLVPFEGLRYKSPVFPCGRYTLRIIPLGKGGVWFSKNGTRFGSVDCFVRVTGFSIV